VILVAVLIVLSARVVGSIPAVRLSRALRANHIIGWMLAIVGLCALAATDLGWLIDDSGANPILVLGAPLLAGGIICFLGGIVGAVAISRRRVGARQHKVTQVLGIALLVGALTAILIPIADLNEHAGMIPATGRMAVPVLASAAALVASMQVVASSIRG